MLILYKTSTLWSCQVFGAVAGEILAEQVSAILQNNNALKYKDPGCPTISYFIGEHKIERALLDLGASVNLLPYSVFQSLI